jgi:hypothetical protein
MRRLLPLALAFTVLLAGCGGGGGGEADKGGFVSEQLPSVTTTYTGNLIDRYGTVVSTITLVVNPNGSYSFSTPYGPGYTATGSLTSGGVNAPFSEYFTITPNAWGEWDGLPTPTGVTYTGGGNIHFSTNISGSIQFANPGVQSYTPMTFSANAT